MTLTKLNGSKQNWAKSRRSILCAMPVLGTGKLERVQAAVDAESIELDV